MKTNYQAQRSLPLKTKILAAGGLLVLVRMLSNIPTPFTSPDYMLGIMKDNMQLGFFDLLTGNALSSMSLMALGVSPYITASIIIQLLTVVFRKLEEMQHGDEDQRKKLEKATVILGIVLSFLQALAMAIGCGKTGLIDPYSWQSVLVVALAWTLGASICIGIGKLITDRYVGNGISLILVTGILASFPENAFEVVSLAQAKAGKLAPVFITLFAILVFFVFAFVIFIDGCEKRIPVQYASGASIRSSVMQDIPIKLCQGSVVPVIFASTFMSFPGMALSFFGQTPEWVKYLSQSYWFDPARMRYSIGCILFVVLIYAFSYFYADIEMNPRKLAEEIKKGGGVIPGFRPGKPTAEYIEKQMRYTILIGASAISLVAVLPIIVSGVFGLSRLSFLGTSVIIVCGVIMETKKTLQAETGSKKRRKLTGRKKK